MGKTISNTSITEQNIYKQKHLNNINTTFIFQILTTSDY